MEDNNKQSVPEPEYIVACIDCRGVQNSERVMKSSWYQSGVLPPCQMCGGVTREVPVSQYDKFVKDTEGGKKHL